MTETPLVPADRQKMTRANCDEICVCHFCPAIEAFRSIKFHTIAIGDNYNDTPMLGAADKGILFHPSETVKRDFPQFTVVENHGDLKTPVAAFLRE
jgi:hypothetical protein